MDAIYIPQLTRAPEQTEVLEFKEFLPDLETLTPVQGQLKVTHRGNYLEVSVQAETIITLACHRCLQNYNHRLDVDASELIWLDESAGDADAIILGREVGLEDLVESLSPQGNFDAAKWLYEQLCLAIPQRQLCDPACTGIKLSDSLSSSGTDSRWASLEALRKQLPS
ncbi:DUF177 domain-containing protein [Trichocoleus sp. FACHB-591]|uniref:YceD family protein n=1 Tax=Trichocoleus sp. FACHB-591 TaxID=2692872 RepID=UPI0016855D1F|nr:YceD family protein [Trichocoleus sp. FACHB-591]MBD2096942.1 DUF177 domain-containing protein [Trichocoleus sp. FACHB-591]